jgi:hypothetical protein
MLDVMSFYYLFIPTWIFSILLYTFLAGRSGAREKYPEQEKKETEEKEQIVRYQDWQKNQEPIKVVDHSLFTKILHIISLIALAITMVLGLIVLFGSSDETTYLSNRENFYFIGFICTLAYFITAYWAMHRGKKIATQ